MKFRVERWNPRETDW